MSWSNAQKGRVKRYQGMAKLPDFEYRALLVAITGESSSTAKGLTQDDFDRFMARLEAVLWERFGQGECDHPPQGVLVDYWQHRCPPVGMINSRHERLIQALFEHLLPFLSEADVAAEARRPGDYLLRMAHKASGAPVGGLQVLTEREAVRLIEALKDRLRGHGIDTQRAGWTEYGTRRPVAVVPEEGCSPLDAGCSMLDTGCSMHAPGNATTEKRP